MNKIPFLDLGFYEFRLDPKTAQDVYNEMINSKVFWHKMEGLDNSYVGSLDESFLNPWYNEKLFNWFQECLDVVSKNHFHNIGLTIIDSWLNYYTPGSYANAHNHNASIVSGCYYFTDHKHSNTVFTGMDPWIQDIEWLFNTDNIKKQEIKMQPEAGKLLIWKSTIPHHVEKHRDVKPRYTLAFNAFVDKVICRTKTQNLEINCVSIKDRHQKHL